MAHGRTWPGDVQLEYCEICGVRLPAAKRIQATTQELAGRWVCPKCAPLVLNPSYLDYGGPGNLAPTPGEIEPHSGVDWITEIQGESRYSWFYAGTSDPQGTPDTTSGVSDTNVFAIPFVLPRRLVGNVIQTVGIDITTVVTAPCVIELALYKQTKLLANPGVLVADLGSMTAQDGQTGSVAPDLFLVGDAIYFLMYRSNGIATSPGFSATYSNDLLGDGINVFGKIMAGTEWVYGNPWPLTAGRVPWQKFGAPGKLPAFKITLES